VNGVNSNNNTFNSVNGNALIGLEYNPTGGFDWTGANPATANSPTSPPNVPALSATGTGNHQVSITASSGSFYFDDFYIGENESSALYYMIFGINNGTVVYCVNSLTNSPCSGSNPSQNYKELGGGTTSYTGSNIYYTQVANPDASIPVTEVVIDTKDITSGSTEYLDNFIVTATPEPDSLVLLGTGFGLLGVAVFLRRRRRMAAQGTAA
jgi:hypothetical protein